MSTRRGRSHPPPPPTPRILHLPRRTRRRSTMVAATRRQPQPRPEYAGNPSGSLEALFDRDRSFKGDRRARVASRSPSPSSPGRRGGWRDRGDSEEERWRLEAEVLRAECNFLRMEREVALQKLESNRGQMEAVLRSAVQTLVSGRKKIEGERGMHAVLQEEIEVLQSNLELLHRWSRRQRSSKRCTSDDLKLRGKSSGRNFDTKALLLRRRLEEMTVRVTKTTSRRYEEEEEEEEEETCVREIREIASESTSLSTAGKEKRRNCEVVEAETGDSLVPDWIQCRFHDVEMLRRTMEGTSKVMLQRMESYQYSTLSPASSSSSPATAADLGAHDPRVTRAPQEGGMAFCPGRCREMVGRIAEQVRAEAEQWNEMQGMLVQVQREMQDLQCSRDFWERCAVASDAKLRAANAKLLEWRQRAQASHQRVSELHAQVRELRVDLETLRRELSRLPTPVPSIAPAPAAAASPSSSRPHPQLCSLDPPRRIKCHHASPPSPQQQQPLHKEDEKRVPFRRPKENQLPSRMPAVSRPTRRPPLQEIGNTSAFSHRT